MDIAGLIKELFHAVGSFFGWSKHRSELNNTPEMKRADASRKESDQDDEIKKTIADGDLGEIRKHTSP